VVTNKFVTFEWLDCNDCSVVVDGVTFSGLVFNGTKYYGAIPNIRVNDMKVEVRNCTSTDTRGLVWHYCFENINSTYYTPSLLKYCKLENNNVTLADTTDHQAPGSNTAGAGFCAMTWTYSAEVSNNTIVLINDANTNGVDFNVVSGAEIIVHGNTITNIAVGRGSTYAIKGNNYGSVTGVTAYNNTITNVFVGISGKIQYYGNTFTNVNTQANGGAVAITPP
jgi:hypothetical protein